MKSYNFNIEAYQEETQGLPDAEDLAYRRMIDLYYLTEGPLPTEMSKLVEIVGLDDDCIQPVLDRYFELTPQGYAHSFLDEQIRKRKSAAERGRMGGRPKKLQYAED